MSFGRLAPKVPQRKLWQSGAARQASTGQSTRDEGSARWAAQKGPAGSAGRLSVQNSHSGCFEQGITLTVTIRTVTSIDGGYYNFSPFFIEGLDL